MASRSKQRASRTPDDGDQGPVAPPPTWREVVRRPAFRSAVLRQALPVLGVLFFHWEPIDIAAFFLLDAWLFLTLRMAVEMTSDPKYATPGRESSVADLLKNSLVAGVAWALGVGIIVLVTIVPTFPTEDLVGFAVGSWREPSFLVGFTVMVAGHLWEARGFAERCRERSRAERRADDTRIRVMFGRLMLVSLAGAVIGLAKSFGVGGPVLVIIIACVVAWLDAAPEQADGLLGFGPSRTRR
jgi:hypothetical protein